MQSNSLTSFSGQPCQVFAASRPFGNGAKDVSGKLLEFFKTWESHGVRVQGGFTILEDRFLIVSQLPGEISGCSRDALLFFLKDLGSGLGLEWLGGARVFYRDADGTVRDTDRPGFKRLASEGSITADTVVFDTTVREVNAILENRFALPAHASWHRRYFDSPAVRA